MSDDPKLPAVTAPVTPVPLPESFETPAAAQLARDLAIRMYDEPAILKKHGLTPEQFETLRRYEWFQKLVQQLSIEWNTPKNAQQRLATEALVGLESALPDMIARMKVKNEPLAGIAQLSKVLADIAGVGGANRVQAPPTEKFTITINLGADQEIYEKSKAITVEPGSFSDTVTEVSGGLQSLLAIQTEPEKT